MDTTIEGIKALRAAIVRQACLDYLTILKSPKKKIYVGTWGGKKHYETETTMKRWFHSKEFKKWCGADGEAILAGLRSNHENGVDTLPEVVA